MCCDAIKITDEKLGQQHYCSILNYNKMKKIYLILLTVFLNMVFFSCTPNSVNEDLPTVQTDIGEDGEIEEEDEDDLP